MRAENEVAFDNRRAARTRDEPNKARVIIRVLFLKHSEGFQKVGHKLFAPSQYEKVRGQN